MRRPLHLLILGALASALALLPVLAAADNTVLTVGSTGGTAVAQGDTITAGLASGTSAVFANGSNASQAVTCASSTQTATAGTNGTTPGTAIAALTNLTFSSCTINVIGASNPTVTVDNLNYDVTIDTTNGNNPAAVTIAPDPNSAGPIQTTVNLSTAIGPITCVYQLTTPPSIPGTASNANGISFSGVSFTKVSGPGTCFSSATFSATYFPVTDTTQGGQQVLVN
jgi:hypothetical protein